MSRDFILPSGGKLKIVDVYNGAPNAWSFNVNVKNVLPKVYDRLTIDNFGVTRATANVIDPGNRGVTIASYDPSTGILSLNSGGSDAIFTYVLVKAFYV